MMTSPVNLSWWRVLLVSIFLPWGADPVRAEEPAGKPLPAEVVKAWEQAGAQVGWMIYDPSYQIDVPWRFVPEKKREEIVRQDLLVTDLWNFDKGTKYYAADAQRPASQDGLSRIFAIGADDRPAA